MSSVLLPPAANDFQMLYNFSVNQLISIFVLSSLLMVYFSFLEQPVFVCTAPSYDLNAFNRGRYRLLFSHFPLPPSIVAVLWWLLSYSFPLQILRYFKEKDWRLTKQRTKRRKRCWSEEVEESHVVGEFIDEEPEDKEEKEETKRNRIKRNGRHGG